MALADTAADLADSVDALVSYASTIQSSLGSINTPYGYLYPYCPESLNPLVSDVETKLAAMKADLT